MPTLALLRHGESVWNKKNVFTGWVDVPLSEKGVEEALKAGEVLANIEFQAVYVSTLVRAMMTAMLVLLKNGTAKSPVVMHDSPARQADWSKIYGETILDDTIPVYADWHLNERYYGELQGLNKKETADVYGAEQVQIWRRSYDVPPPGGEALKDTAERTIPFFQDVIVPALEKGRNVLVSAHGNSLRSIVMHLDKLSKDDVMDLELTTGRPLLYNFDGGKFMKLPG